MTKKQIEWMVILGLVVFTNIIESMILMPLSSTIKETLVVSDNQWGVIISSYLFSSFIAGVLSIFVIDRFDRKNAIIIVYTLFIIGTSLCAIAESYAFLIFARIFAGFFGGIISAIVLAIVGDLIAVEHRGKATGIVMAGFSTAAAIGVPMGLYLGLNFNWHAPFYFIIGLSILIWFGLFFRLPEMKGHFVKENRVKPGNIILEILKNRNQVKALFFSVILLFGQFGIIPFLADYVHHNIGFEQKSLVWMYFFGGILTFATNPIIGYLADKFGQVSTFLILMLLSCIPIYFITSIGHTPMFIVLIITSGFFVFAGGRNVPGTAIVIGTAAPYQRGAFMSLRSAFQQLMSGVSVMIASAIVFQDENQTYHNFEWVGYIAIFTSLISFFILKSIKVTH
jgi:predicted MFS family arabinose efflux permease